MKRLLFTIMQLITVTVLKYEELVKCEGDGGYYFSDEFSDECFKSCNSDQDCESDRGDCFTFSLVTAKCINENLYEQSIKNPNNLKLCIENQQTKLKAYGYKSFSKGTLEKIDFVNEFETLPDSDNDVYNLNVDGKKDYFYKCDADSDCESKLENTYPDYDKNQRCFELIHQTEPETIKICRNTSLLYEWSKRTRKFLNYGFYPITNYYKFKTRGIEKQVHNGIKVITVIKDIKEYKVLETFMKDCLYGKEFIVLNREPKKSDNWIGFCEPGEIKSQHWEMMKNDIKRDFFGGNKKLI